MKCLPTFAARAVLVSVLTLLPLYVQAEKQSGQVFVHATSGAVSCSNVKGVWLPFKAKDRLECGVVIKTGPDSTADLVLGYNKTVLRLTPNSVLKVKQVDQELAGEDVVTEITLELLSGELAGSQRKLALPSRLEIITPVNIARIKGTEYYVRADGAVSVTSGSVAVSYDPPGHGGSVSVIVAAGYTFDPLTRTVVPTSIRYLQNILAHITTTQQTAIIYKLAGATIVVRTEDGNMSPVKPSPPCKRCNCSPCRCSYGGPP